MTVRPYSGIINIYHLIDGAKQAKGLTFFSGGRSL